MPHFKAFRPATVLGLLFLVSTLAACAAGSGPADASTDDGQDAVDGGDEGGRDGDQTVDGDPGDVDPGDPDPGDPDPGDGDPGDVDSGDVDPGDGEPGDLDPTDGGDGEPGDPDPGDGDPTDGGDAGPSCTGSPGQAGELSHSRVSHTISVGDPAVDLPLTITLPDGAGPYPVVVLLHGFQLSPDLYGSYGDHLASWGYVVIMPQMPGSLFSSPTHTTLKGHAIDLLDWIDTEAANASGPLAGKADPGRLGLAGHSMGGKIALLVATEDARPRAVFGMDPVDAAAGPFGTPNEDYPSVTPELMGEITVPLTLLGETTNATCSGAFCQACAPEDDNFHQYYLYAESPAVEIEVLGANHMSFLDDPNCGLTCSVCPAGTDDPAVTRRLTRKYMTAFFQVSLKGDASFRCHLVGASMAGDVSAGLVLSTAKNGF